MHRASFTAILALVGAAVFVATRGEGWDRIAAGVMGGVFLGCCVGLLSHGLVGLALRQDTEAAFKALVIGFAAKFAGAVLPWAVLTFLEPAHRLADGTAYLIAFAASVMLVLAGGIFDHLRLAAQISDENARARETETSSSPVSTGSSTPLESAS